jgi:two-component system NtrC family response regulator
MLVREFVRRFEPTGNVEISSELLDMLASHSWPGNIRELENLIERMLVLRKGNNLNNHDLPADFGDFARQRTADLAEKTENRLTFQKAEENLVRDALQKCGWNRTRAAKYLNIPRHVLIYRIKKYGIKEYEAE